MIPQQIKKQRTLMREAVGILDDITAIQVNFDATEPLVNLKIGLLQKKYAETVTELAKLLMETIPS